MKKHLPLFIVLGIVVLIAFVRLVGLPGANKSEPYVFGVYTATGYESKFLQYHFETPEGCELDTQEELAERMGISLRKFDGDHNKLRMEMAEKQEIYDLSASMDSGVTVNVSLDMVPTDKMDYDDLVAGVKEELAEAICVIEDDYEMTEIFGRECAKVEAYLPIHGTTVVREVYVFKGSGYICNVLVSYAEAYEADKDILLSSFEKL